LQPRYSHKQRTAPFLPQARLLWNHAGRRGATNTGDGSEDPEPFCDRCGADIGIFLKFGLDWRHYRASSLDDIELFDPGNPRSSPGASTRRPPPDPRGNVDGPNRLGPPTFPFALDCRRTDRPVLNMNMNMVCRRFYGRDKLENP
jgi:hypothetical protein